MNKDKFELDFFDGYALALASTALAAGARWLLPEALSPAPYLVFYPAVVASAALGGAGPGLAATFGSLILVNFVFGHFDIHDHGAVARQAIWVFASIGVSLLTEMQRKARALERRGTEQLRLLTDELETRVAQRTSELQQANLDLRAANQKLAEIDQARTDFFANVSHEFRTPLTLMLGPLDDALDDRLTELSSVQRDRLALARRNGRRLLKLVNTLLDFARFEAGCAVANLEPTDLALATKGLASHFQSACEIAGLRLVVDCPALEAPVFVDRDMWEKIVLNLVSNAFKHTLKGEIVVRLRADGEEVELTVSDTGAGMAPDETPHLFELFHRARAARGRSVEGTGIGLALVQELVKLHGGSIWAESQQGQGSTFHVRIPLRAAGPGAETAPVTDLAAKDYVEEAIRWLPDDHEAAGLSSLAGVDSIQASGGRPLVLLADDNSDMRDYVGRILAAAGCDVLTALDGEAVLTTLRGEHRPDLVLTDVMMPKLDGFSLLATIRDDPGLADVPVILLSARAGEEACVEGLAAGADDYLVKPFSARELVAHVEGALRLAKLRREKAESERRTVENALGLTEDRLSMALDSGRMGTWDWDVSADKMIWSPMIREIFGIANDEPPSFRLFFDRLHPGDRDAVDTLRRRSLDPNIRAPYDGQFRVVCPNGGVHWVLERGKVYFEDARPIRFVGIAIDVSEQKAAEAHLRVMVDELSHRVKNTLAVVQSITAQTFRGRGEIGGIREALDGRLQSLADTHTLLTLSDWESVDLASLVEKSVGHLGKAGDAHFTMAGPELGLNAKAALALGLALHELSANAAKYGAWSTEHGAVRLNWRVSGDSMVMEWTESGLKDLTPPVRKGFGSRMMTRAIEYDLAGEAKQIWRPEGLHYVLTIPLVNSLASAEAASISVKAAHNRSGL